MASYYRELKSHGQGGRPLAFVYKADDQSPLYNHVLSPFARVCVETLVPRWLAPNTITALGLAAQIVALAAVLATSTVGPPPGWVAVLAGVCLFAYQTLDNMDGKQARRTGTSTALGLLFDHGLDAINAGLVGTTIFTLLTGAGYDTWRPYASWSIATTTFFLNTWEDYHIGTFILGPMNGPDDGLTAMSILFICIGWFGSGFLHQPPPSHALVSGLVHVATPAKALVWWLRGAPAEEPITSNLDLMLLLFITGMIVTGVANTARVLYYYFVEVRRRWAAGVYGPETRGFLWHAGRAMWRQHPLWLQHAIAAAWLYSPLCRQQITETPQLWYLAIGSAFATVTSQLMVSHVAGALYYPALLTTWMLAVPPTVEWLLTTTSTAITGDATMMSLRAVIGRLLLGNESLEPAAVSAALYQLLLACALFNVLAFGLFFVRTVRDVAAAIGVNVFDSARHERARKRLARDPRPHYPLTNVLPPLEGGTWYVPSGADSDSELEESIRRPHIIGGLTVSLDADASNRPPSPPTPTYLASSQPDPDERPPGFAPLSDDSRIVRRVSRARAGSTPAARGSGRSR